MAAGSSPRHPGRRIAGPAYGPDVGGSGRIATQLAAQVLDGCLEDAFGLPFGTTVAQHALGQIAIREQVAGCACRILDCGASAPLFVRRSPKRRCPPRSKAAFLDCGAPAPLFVRRDPKRQCPPRSKAAILAAIQSGDSRRNPKRRFSPQSKAAFLDCGASAPLFVRRDSKRQCPPRSKAAVPAAIQSGFFWIAALRRRFSFVAIQSGSARRDPKRQSLLRSKAAFFGLRRFGAAFRSSRFKAAVPTAIQSGFFGLRRSGAAFGSS